MYWCFQESEQNACETDALETRLYFDFADGDTSLRWTIIKQELLSIIHYQNLE